jgi:Flp pilus assembly protein TadG
MSRNRGAGICQVSEGKVNKLFDLQKRTSAQSLKCILADRSGASIVIIALSFLALAGFVGLSIEVGSWYMERRAMQSAVDSAALSGAYVIYQNQNNIASLDPNILAAARNDARRNGYDDAATDVSVTMNHPFAGDLSRVEVVMTKTMAGNISTLFGPDSTTISRRAVARVDSRGRFCMLGLAENCPHTMWFSGNSDSQLDGCPIMSNSISQDSFFGMGTGNVSTPSISAAGSVTIGSNFAGGLTLPPGEVPHSNVQPMPDPYAAIPEYANPGGCQPLPNIACTGSAAHRAATPGCTSGNPFVMIPGCYNDLDFGNNRYFRLNAGNYYTNGDIAANGSVVQTATGAGVTFHMGPSSHLNINTGNTAFNVAAPTSGIYNGILFFQSRSAPTDSCLHHSNRVEGGGLTLAGSIYIPRQGLRLNGNGATTGSTCLRIVARYLELNGGADMNVNCNGAGGGGGTDYLPPTLVE